MVDTYLKPTYVKSPPENPDLNHIIDISVQWFRSYFYFIATYAVPHPKAITPTVQWKFARLTYQGVDRFLLSSMRYNGEWIELYSDLTMEECLEAIKSDPWFQM